MIKYEYNKEFYEKYMRNMMLVFSDNEITEENMGITQEKLKEYKTLDHEIIENEVVYDKEKAKYLIILVIICSRMLLKDVNEENYQNFIIKHIKCFIEFYEKEVVPILD